MVEEKSDVAPDAEKTSVAQEGAGDIPPTEDVSKKEGQIIKQVEYYFGDINLPRDKFLLENIQSDDGWITLDTMIKFRRLASITTDFGEITTALKKSRSGLMEIDAENNKIRRSPHVPLPEMNEKRRKDLTSRSAYIKRFPLDHTIDQLLEFFSKHAPDYEGVQMRHYHDKAENVWKFKGSVYISFKSLEACKKFVEGPELEYNDVKLEKMLQCDYLEEKRKERLLDKSKHKKKGSKQEKNGSKSEEQKGSGGEEEDEEFPPGASFQLTGFKENSQTKRETIKAKVEGYGFMVVFIDFNIGEQVAWVRMEQKDSAKELAKKVQEEEGEKITVGEDELSLRVLEGDEEKARYAKAKEEMLKRRQHSNKHKGGRNRGGHRRRGGYQGRKRAGSPVSRNDEKKAKS